MHGWLHGFAGTGGGARRLAIGLAASAAAALSAAAPPGEPFAPPSGDGAGGLVRLAPEESGLEAASRYRDPRAWGERLDAASVGAVGTGVGVGDFDGDGWPDLFVALREDRNRLYINEKGRGFRDRTEAAGILESPDWTTGATVADIDGDGRPDIYVCFFDAPNRLYLNQGGAVFEEAAGPLGLDARDASSGAFFADYDRDGDLDLYLQTNFLYTPGGQPDRFYRNDGEAGFVEATEAVGIRSGREGATLGHSVLWVDYDGDGWEDLYVANDFKAPDFLYLNNGDGTFRDASERIPVAPFSSMGSDLGDVNGDGRLDLLATDMATPSYVKHVESMLTSGVKTRQLSPDSRPVQVMKNALLLNRGRGDYVDVAYAWGLAATDWTWAPRLIDVDNDGWPDALFTNGMIRQFHNADLALEQDRQTTEAAKRAVYKRSPVLREPNLAFRNRAGRGFEPANERWGFRHEGVSFGAAALDFDRDGDLDFVYTNYEAPPALWRNDLGAGDAVQVRLVGDARNRQAIGALAVARWEGRRQARKILANRGYLGSDEKLLHFGLGGAESLERLDVLWPDGMRQTVRDLEAGRRYVVEKPAAPQEPAPSPPPEFSPPPARFVRTGAQDGRPPPSAEPSGAGRGALLYPFKPAPGPPRPRLIREDFDGDGKPDSLILRDWKAPRLIVSDGGMKDASETWGTSRLAGLWPTAFADDFDGDGRPDVLLGGMGINNEVSFRSDGEGRLVRRVGRFSPEGARVNFNAYEWGDVMRPYDGLRDYTEIDSRLLERLGSFRATGNLDAEAFIERTGYIVEETYEIDRFRSGLLINESGRGFRFEPLPLEAQYGRVWDAAAADLDGDGARDLVLLLGYATPHYRSPQPEGSFLCVLLGEGGGTFVADGRPPLDEPPGARAVGLELDEAPGQAATLTLLLEDGVRVRYRLAEAGRR